VFQRILLAWPLEQPPRTALDVARSLADAYETELAVCCLGAAASEARAAVGRDVPVEVLPAAHAARELVRYAHEHAFDLLVVGRVSEEDPLPRRLAEWAPMPVLVVPA
jgi:nucleotide-binding universal stress UspA family protein